ncbi:hypothetical protein BDB01DRAFT_854984 [Pilobolus umbonatus]|nr:hypothetical protein BDB01DRAFT_854984 [Pilobolus umbonatus]
MNNINHNNDPNTNNKHLEITPRMYYEHYMPAPPNYDLYPSLSRRLNNGYIHTPSRATQPKQINFISIHSSRQSPSFNNNDHYWQPQPHPQETAPSWDLYPAIFRRVHNFGTDQMRQTLRTMESTVHHVQ